MKWQASGGKFMIVDGKPLMESTQTSTLAISFENEDDFIQFVKGLITSTAQRYGLEVRITKKQQDKQLTTL